MKLSSILAVMVALFFAAGAHAKKSRYAGPHPLAPSVGGGMCYIDVPHTHAYEPHDVDVLYVHHGGRHVYVGDPTAFGEDHPHHAYYGHHPLHWAHDDHWCWISGPHHHWYAPPATVVGFTSHGGAFWYVGARPDWYAVRVHQYRHVDAYYVGLPIMRFSVDVEPPVGFFGFYVMGPWVPARVAWYAPDGKGPPPWAPAWGHRGFKGNDFKDFKNDHGPKHAGFFDGDKGGPKHNDAGKKGFFDKNNGGPKKSGAFDGSGPKGGGLFGGGGKGGASAKGGTKGGKGGGGKAKK